MNTKFRITAAWLVIVSCLLLCIRVTAQNGPETNKTLKNMTGVATISQELVIGLPDGAVESAATTWVFDIRHLPFKSAASLSEFCALFSMDFHTFEGDFEKRQLTLTLNLETITRKGFSTEDINEYFRLFAGRIQNFFQYHNH